MCPCATPLSVIACDTTGWTGTSLLVWRIVKLAELVKEQRSMMDVLNVRIARALLNLSNPF